MNPTPDSKSVLAFTGSLRSGSLNRILIRHAVEGAKAEGAQVTLIDLREFPVPLYDGDLEEKGFPESVLALKKLFRENAGILISSPEYNGSIPGVLKNYIDWMSRTAPGEEPLECLDEKVVSLLSASPGGFGGMRGLMALRWTLTAVGCFVLPEQFSLPKAHEAFLPDGSFKEPKLAARPRAIGADLARMLKKVKG